MAPIPFFTLVRQNITLKREIDRVLKETVAHGTFILGDNVSAFEKEFGRYLGVGHAVGVGSGTDALTLAIRALGLANRDEVLVPANCYPTVFGVAQSGVSVRLVDCGEDGNISLTDLSKRITKRTKAIVVVHLYSNPADILGVKKIVGSRIRIIEDCAQAHGATIGSKKVGTFGDIACFSFYPTKNLGAFGDGGMVVTENKIVADRVRALRMYGERERYKSLEVSGVSRLDELQAAVLRIKLRHLDRWNKKRKELAGYYEAGLKDLPAQAGISVIKGINGSCHHLFVIRTKRRDGLQKYLTARHIGTAVHYPVPIHQAPAFASLGYRRGDFPIAETLSREVVSLPFFPEMTEREVNMVVMRIKEFLQKYR